VNKWREGERRDIAVEGEGEINTNNAKGVTKN